MISGLLWYDDDTHRPLAEKIGEAAQRYRERVGYEPTTCQLHPSHIPSAAANKSKRGKTTMLPLPLRLQPNEHLRPNYFYVGVLDGERLRRAVNRRPVRGGSALSVPAEAKPKPGKVEKSSAPPAKSGRVHRLKAS